MIKYKIQKASLLFYLFHPLTLAFIVWAILAILLPNYFSKYKAEIVNTKRYVDTTKILYHDLDGDTISEELIVNFEKDELVPEIVYFDSKKRVLGQWNLRGNWLLKQKLFFGDYNKNGYDEVYCFTRNNDSIYLNCNELLLKNGVHFEDRFICTSLFFNVNKNDTHVVDGSMLDIDKDGFDEFVFTLSSGLSKQPRNTFGFYLNLDSLISSPTSGSCFFESVNFMDLNNDGVNEMTGSVSSPENIHYELPYPDSCTWLMVIDPSNGMDFLFPPVEFNQRFSSIEPVFYELHNDKYIVCFYTQNSSVSDSNNAILLYNCNGNLLKKKMISNDENYQHLNYIDRKVMDDDKLYVINKKGSFYSADTSLNFQLVSTNSTDGLFVNTRFNSIIDIDNDGNYELIYRAGVEESEKLLIYNSNLKDFVIVNLPKSKYIKYWNITKLVTDDRLRSMIVLHADDIVYYIDYGKSWYYLLKYPVYIIGFFVLLLFFGGLQRAQTIVAVRKFENEKQLIRQQMALTKRQLEPHFMLNTLNNIGYMFSTENKDDAQYYFGRFASLIHRGLKYADQTETSLFEELEFVKDYLILQQKRFNDDFLFTIDTDKNIDLDEILIPHSLVYTFVENAVKHGLSHKEGNKILKINVSEEGNNITISITDNGIGRKQSKVLKTTGTGKGMGIVESIVEGYNKLNGRNISYKVNDIDDVNNENAGTNVTIIV